MKVVLGKPIVSAQGREHADVGDVLDVIFKNESHLICMSKNFEGVHIPVFNKQVVSVIRETAAERVDEYADEKYYNIYDEDIIKVIEADNDTFNTAFEEYDE